MIRFATSKSPSTRRGTRWAAVAAGLALAIGLVAAPGSPALSRPQHVAPASWAPAGQPLQDWGGAASTGFTFNETLDYGSGTVFEREITGAASIEFRRTLQKGDWITDAYITVTRYRFVETKTYSPTNSTTCTIEATQPLSGVHRGSDSSARVRVDDGSGPSAIIGSIGEVSLRQVCTGSFPSDGMVTTSPFISGRCVAVGYVLAPVDFAEIEIPGPINAVTRPQSVSGPINDRCTWNTKPGAVRSSGSFAADSSVSLAQYTLPTSPPPVFTKAPKKTTSKKKVKIAWAGPLPAGGFFVCSYNGWKDSRACTSPMKVKVPKKGKYRFSVSVRWADPNYGFELNTSGPTVRWKYKPKPPKKK